MKTRLKTHGLTVPPVLCSASGFITSQYVLTLRWFRAVFGYRPMAGILR